MRLYINIDHVATLRQARRATEPDPVEAALACERAGADGITAHLREDRRHIQDADIRALRDAVTTVFNLEIACSEEMIGIALDVAPDQVTLVPEKREEVTTEGGLDVAAHTDAIRYALERLKNAGIRTSLFIDPDPRQVSTSAALGADAIELHTGTYSHTSTDESISALAAATMQARGLGVDVHAGHGLTKRNVGRVAALRGIEELNIGHSIVSRAVLIGIEAAVGEMRAAIKDALPQMEIVR